MKRKSKLLRWAYLLSDDGPPPQISLCVLFWRAVLLTPLKVAFAVALLLCFAVALCQATVGLVLYWKIALPALLGTLGICYWAFKPARSDSNKLGLVAEYVKAKKRRVCPLIEIED